MNEALNTWREKLAYFQQQEAIASEPAQKFALAKQIEEAKAKIAELEATTVSDSTSAPDSFPGTFRADISRIIKYAPAELIGREEETKLLTNAWDMAVRREKKRPHILTFVALGGEGKTSLVAKWAASLAADDWPGCDAVFAWSFYSQGTREQTAVSSDLFLAEALTFFGDPVMAGSARSAFDKGRRLAQLIGERRALLILDGLEPLQYAPTSPTAGELKDQGISALLKGLAAVNYGLCVVTTRYSVTGLRNYLQTTAPEIRLLHLSGESGVQLLRSLGVRRESGSREDFEKVVDQVQGHALTLNLLGAYLHDAHGGNIRKCDRVNLEVADAEEQGGHAFRVMDAYVKWFMTEGERGQRAVAVLRLLGLFDRPASADSLAALRKLPVILNLTEALVGMTEPQTNVVLSRLEAARLLTVNRNSAGTLVSLDAHPLLREYFAQRLRAQRPDAWRDAHRRLYKHLLASGFDKPKPELEDLQSVYQAVTHGCRAGLHRHVWEEVFEKQLERDSHFATLRLGAVGADLAALSCFFDAPWAKINESLSPACRALIYCHVGFRLRAVGRLSEAIDPSEHGLAIDLNRPHWRGAAIIANNLSELYLALGDIRRAIEYAKDSVGYAKASADWVELRDELTTYAEAQFQAGMVVDALRNFKEAEFLQIREQRDYPLLHALRGSKYCDLLLSDVESAAWKANLILLTGSSPADKSHRSLIDKCQAVSRRGEQTLWWAEESNASLLTIALNHLTLGRAAFYKALLEGSALDTCNVSLQQAVDGLRSAGQEQYIPSGLLIRAWLRFLTGARTDRESAQTDLDEAWEITERGPMRLFMADIHLYRARLFHGVKPYPWATDAEGNARGPKDDLAAARRLIEQCGYWRRKEELEDAEEASKNW